MIARLTSIFCMMGGAVCADPLFEDITAALPDHQYTGGWEHFVGGGVSAFDCSADGRPDLVAAGGTSPMILLKNVSEKDQIAFDPVSVAGEILTGTECWIFMSCASGLIVFCKGGRTALSPM